MAAPTQAAIDAAQLDVNFSAPALKDWFPPLATAADMMGQFMGLARNAADVAASCYSLMSTRADLFPVGTPPPQCGRRLKTLLEYFLAVIGDFYQENKGVLEALDRDVVPIAYAVKKALKLHGKRLNLFLMGISNIWHNRPPWVGVQTHAFARHTAWPGIPSEPMMELLGQLYIYAAEHPAGGAVPVLSTAIHVQALLRSMVAPPVWRTQNRDDYRGTKWKGNGTVNCMFATQHKPGGPILLGTTAPEFGNRDIKDSFRRARLSRFPAAMAIELLNCFNQTDHNVCSVIIEFLSANGSLASPVSHAFSLSMNGILIARPSGFLPLIHLNQIAQSHFVQPGIAHIHDPWFQYVPRCLKCRVIQVYNIFAEALDGPAKLNVPLGCAEDLVHPKIRALYPGEDPHLDAGP